MRLLFSPAAAKALTRMPRKEGTLLLEKLQQVARDPVGRHGWVKPLTGVAGFRVRQGDWRALYRLDYETGDMVVDKIARRDEVYR